MKIVSSLQMRNLDLATQSKYNVPSLDLMERAGRGLAEKAISYSGHKKGTIAIIAGRGNNGGDGLVAARHLIGVGREIYVVILANPSELSPDARANFEFLAPLTTHIFFAGDVPTFNTHAHRIANAVCIIDAIFGTGLDREVTGLPSHVIKLINSLDSLVVAADIPSGLSSDTGQPLSVAVKAFATVTFGLPKLGLFLGQGPSYAGRIDVVDIGLALPEIEKVHADTELVDTAMFRGRLPRRHSNSHKGSFGHVAVFAGSRGHIGAGYLTSQAALRTGCGLVTYCIPEKVFVRFDARYPEIMCDVIPDDASAAFHPSSLTKALESTNGKDVVAIGPAIGTSNETKKFLNEFLKQVKLPVVLDADGLNNLELSTLKARRAPTVITPHPGEMARLTGLEIHRIQADRVGIARKFAKEHGVVCVLKGNQTVICHPDGRTFINSTGNPGMASAGMGDALTGMIASLLAQKMDVVSATTLAVFIHGLAGDIAASELGERALITSDVIRCLPKAFDSVEEKISLV